MHPTVVWNLASHITAFARGRVYDRPVLRLAPVLAIGCQHPIGDLDGAFYDGDGRAVHCAVNLDDSARNGLASIDSALDRAAEREEVVELYAHDPGRTVPIDKIEHVLAGAAARGLQFFTYRDFVNNYVSGRGIALSFDDTYVYHWLDIADLLAAHDARVTFFVSQFRDLGDERVRLLHRLADAGHDIEAHSVRHEKAPLYVEERGVAAYLAEEAVPSIDALAAAGFAAPVAYAYPYGARTDELDDALLAHVSVLRSVVFSYEGVARSPCPH